MEYLRLGLVALALGALLSACSLTYNLSGIMSGTNGEVSHGKEESSTENSGLPSLEQSDG